MLIVLSTQSASSSLKSWYQSAAANRKLPCIMRHFPSKLTCQCCRHQASPLKAPLSLQVHLMMTGSSSALQVGPVTRLAYIRETRSQPSRGHSRAPLRDRRLLQSDSSSKLLLQPQTAFRISLSWQIQVMKSWLPCCWMTASTAA